jgi:hypothetical protein
MLGIVIVPLMFVLDSVSPLATALVENAMGRY